MTEASGFSETGIPGACTLPAAERPVRVAEFDALFAAVIAGERVSARRLRLVLQGRDDLAEDVRDLVAREADCCSFFTFAVAEEPTGAVVVDIEVQVGHAGVLDAWATRTLDGRTS
jgi:hypothetical protein